jgi:hypothetical protein
MNTPVVPPPLRGSDRGSFAESTVKTRLAGLARRALAHPTLPPEACESIEALAAEIPHAPIRRLDDPLAPDLADWHRLVDPYAGAGWLDVPWLFAEFYLFRRVLEATGYFGTGAGWGLDPYAPDKAASLTLAEGPLRALSGLLAADHPSPDTVQAALKSALWGNQADLSLWQAGHGPGHERIDRDGQMLVDHTGIAAHWLIHTSGPLDLGLIADNAGEEFTLDLVLVDILLRLPNVDRLTIHVKSYPTYVSDTTPADVEATLAFLRGSRLDAAHTLVGRLDQARSTGRLIVHDDPVWTQPYPFRRLPDGPYRQIARHDFIVLKGDANYRRLLDDSHWPPTTPFEEIVGYFPAPFLALRTCKAEVLPACTANRSKGSIGPIPPGA